MKKLATLAGLAALLAAPLLVTLGCDNEDPIDGGRPCETNRDCQSGRCIKLDPTRLGFCAGGTNT